VQHLVLTNAAGALHPLLLAGDVVLASDVIRPPAYLGITTSPLLDSTWRRATLAQGMARGLAMREGVYVQVLGPQYETRAEIAMYRRMGAHVIGMSTAVESGVATELGMRVQVLTLVTNRLTDVAAAQLSHDHVLDAAIAWQDRMTTGVTAAIFAACA
jgi:purine-nucleoside phosphorylase